MQPFAASGFDEGVVVEDEDFEVQHFTCVGLSESDAVKRRKENRGKSHDAF